MTTRRQLMAIGFPALLAGGALAPHAFARQAGAQQRPQGPQQPGGGQGGQGGGKLERVLNALWDGKQYTLPPLPYDYAALEPHIDEPTMRLHHDKHHQAYVAGLNRAVKALEESAKGEEEDAARLSGLQRDLSFNFGGHLMHSVFWATMGPREQGGGRGANAGMGGEPVGELKRAIEGPYGSFANFKRHFVNVGKSVKGSGWAVLTYDPVPSQMP